MTNKHYAEISPAKGIIAAIARADGSLLTETTQAVKLLEFNKGKAYPAVFYIPREDIDFSRLVRNEGHATHCPIKGDASYYSLKTEEGVVENIAWSYEDPFDHVKSIKNYLGFDGRLVRITHKPQPRLS